jgi:hypothetical protein
MSVVKIMKKFKVVTLGCKVNAYESEAISNMLIEEGYERCEDNVLGCLGEYLTSFRDNVKYLYDKFD